MDRWVAGVLLLVLVASCSRDPSGDREQTQAVASSVERSLNRVFHIERVDDGDGGCGDGSGRLRLIWQYDSASYSPTEDEYANAVDRLSSLVKDQGGTVRVETDGDVKVFGRIDTTNVSMYRRTDRTVYVEFAGGCV